MVVVCAGEAVGCWPVHSSCMDSFAARTSLDNAAVADALGMLVSVWASWQPRWARRGSRGGCRAATGAFDDNMPLFLL